MTKCARCPHDGHIGVCNGRGGGYAYQCGCTYHTFVDTAPHQFPMSDLRRGIFERVFSDMDRQHSAFRTFSEIVPMQDDADLRKSWDYFRCGWNEEARRPATELEGEIALLRAHRTADNELIVERNRRITELESKLAAQADVLAATERTVASGDVTLGQLRSELAQARQIKSEDDEEIAKLRAEVASVRDAHSRACQERDDLKRKHDGLVDFIAGPVAQERADLRAEVAAVRDDATTRTRAACSEASKLAAEVIHLQRVISSQRAQLIGFSDALTKSRDSVSGLTAEKQVLEETVQVLKTERDRHAGTLAELRQDAHTLYCLARAAVSGLEFYNAAEGITSELARIRARLVLHGVISDGQVITENQPQSVPSDPEITSSDPGSTSEPGSESSSSLPGSSHEP